MKIGIVGLPFSGKSTLFNALTGSAVSTGAHSIGKAEAQHAVVKPAAGPLVPDIQAEKKRSRHHRISGPVRIERG